MTENRENWLYPDASGLYFPHDGFIMRATDGKQYDYEEECELLNEYDKKYNEYRNDVLRLEKEKEQLKERIKELQKESYGNLDGLNYYQEQNGHLSSKISDLECENEQLKQHKENTAKEFQMLYQNGTFSVEDNLFYENNIRIGYFEDEEKEEILENNHKAVVDRLTNLRDSNIDLKRSNKKLRKENKELKAKVDDKEVAVEVETCKVMEKIFDLIDKKIKEADEGFEQTYDSWYQGQIDALKELKKELNDD